MTFGEIKSYIETKLIESYKNEKEFKKNLSEFKQNVLMNKKISKVYSLYDQLSTPQGLTESEAKDYLQEGLDFLDKILPQIKLPKSNNEDIQNHYKDLDTLVYTNNIDLFERISARKNIIKNLTTSKKQLTEHVSIPIKSMVSIANQTIKNFVETMNESDKKEFLNIISEDQTKLENNFIKLKEDSIFKLKSIIESEQDNDLKNKLTETISKIETEDFNQINYLKLKNLYNSIV
jgi:hypothetical protein